MNYNIIISHQRLKVILCQLPYLQRTLEYRRESIPLAAGYLKAMTYKEGLLNEIDVEILDSIHNDLDGDARLVDIVISKKPDILGFSLYPSNAVRSLFIAGEVKRTLPDTKLIVGGPEVAFESSYILSSPNVDIGVFGEGEIPFVNLLKFFLRGKPGLSEIGGIFYKNDSKVIINQPSVSLNELDEIPSPYLLGFIDLSKYSKMTIETARGCSNRCKYCSVYKRSLAKKPFFSVRRIEEELKLAKKMGVKLIDLHDSAFNISPNFKEIADVIKKVNFDKSMVLGVSLIAELVDEDTANLLEECNVKFCEIGLQSTNAEVLANIGRSTKLHKFLKGVNLLKDKGIRLSINIIIGLPGDTLNTFKETISFLKQNQLISDVIFPTVLSVGPATEVRKEAKKFGLKYQPEPPYRVIETDKLPYLDLRSALNLCINLFSNDPPYFSVYPSMASHINNNFIRVAKFDLKKCASSFPVTKIILKIDNRFQDSQQLEKLGKYLSKHIANVITIWFKCADLTNETNLIKFFLSAISKDNPYLIWNILLETKQNFHSSLIQKIQESILHKINNLDYDNFFLSEKPVGYSRQATRVLIIIESANKEAEERWIKEANKSAKVIWSVEFSKDNNYEDKIENLLNKLGDGLLVEFNHNSDTGFILEVLRLIHKKSKTYKKTILFKDFLLQQLWDVVFQKISISLGEREHIINFKKDLTPYSFIFQKREVLPDMLKRFVAFKIFHKTTQDLNKTEIKKGG